VPELTELLAQADPTATAAKAAADLLAAQDVLAMWKAIAVVCASGAVFFAIQWYRCIQADVARLNEIAKVYMASAAAAQAAVQAQARKEAA
jgi:hypothetical protein